MKILLYHQHLMQSVSLIEGRLLLLDSEAVSIANTYIATSGLPNNQRFDCLSSPAITLDLGGQPSSEIVVGSCGTSSQGCPPKSWSGVAPGKGPIPANNVIGVDRYKVVTTPIYMPQVRGVEGNFYKINKAIGDG